MPVFQVKRPSIPKMIFTKKRENNILRSSHNVSPSSVLASAGRDDPPINQRPENALDALLDELQTFARPPGLPQSPTSNRPPSMSEIGRRKGSIDSNNSSLSTSLPLATSSLRRLHSYPSSSDDSSPPTQLRDIQKPATGPKPPVPERNVELLSQLVNRRVPPPPPPRTSSRSPLASPTSPSLPPRATPPSQPQMGINTGTLRRNAPGRSSLREYKSGEVQQQSNEDNDTSAQTSSEGQSVSSSTPNTSSCESVSSQEGIKNKESRKELLEQRHQELLRKQKALQEQYARLQQLQRGATAFAIPTQDLMLKKTGSESNLLSKMGLGQSLSAAAPMSGSLTHLAPQNQVVPLAPFMSTATQPHTTTSSSSSSNPPPPLLLPLSTPSSSSSTTSTTKIYETDIL
ncbi:predicted protein [Pediculus humanus corporis]|uniref:Predicted protein n=1 Tax=Pediculus humanus subsp. corporis TaxID=121224 RepID=E0VA30_PEDHC|nr:uncharacterized protein Phum_PHUM025810 [Pediculus humanus corporis]EEB10236.1 predicted protein [Pediculus humanus corporis]